MKILIILNYRPSFTVNSLHMPQDLLLARLELAYSLIWGSHKIWGKGGGDTLDLL